MPNDRVRVRADAVCVPPEDLDDWIIPLPMYDAGEPVSFNMTPLTLASIEEALGMSSTVDIVSNIKNYIMDNLTYTDEDSKRKVGAKVDRIITALGRDNYTPSRRVSRTPPTHIVYLDDKSVEEFINKLSRCRYIKWRLASPIYWIVNGIGLEGTFKR